jgi:hypothetical protein
MLSAFVVTVSRALEADKPFLVDEDHARSRADIIKARYRMMIVAHHRIGDAISGNRLRNLCRSG